MIKHFTIGFFCRRRCGWSLFAAMASLVLIWGCSGNPVVKKNDHPKVRDFGALPDGRMASLYSMKNRNGMIVTVSDYGCIVQGILVPDREGKIADVALGFDSLKGYLNNDLYFGCIVGRYANRIYQGRFAIGGEAFQLEQNSPPNHIHGGARGFDKVLWDAEYFERDIIRGVKLAYTSPDGDQGYPGTLKVTTTYSLTDNNELIINYEAVTDKATILNLTNHTYFNLADEGRSDVSGHLLQIHSNFFVPVKEHTLPLEEYRDVAGTPMDFTKPVPIGQRINDPDEQLALGKGYDHSWLVDTTGALALAATLYDPVSGRLLETWTTQPAVHLYTGNYLDGTISGKNGIIYEERNGLCIETQHFANSPNIPAFPSTALFPGELYHHITVYRFSVKSVIN